MKVITIGKKLVSVEQVAFVEPFDPTANPEFKPEKDYKGRIVMLNRDIVLTEQTPQEFAAEHELHLFTEDILLDEAQDTNPVVLDVLRKQPAQMIYVGDKYQQIYEWRGAVNAMEKIETQGETYLTTSFRFGPAIAEWASKLLLLLGEKRPLKGNIAVKSRVGSVEPRTILARTNATTIAAIIECLDEGKKPHLVGGTDELIDMLRGVQDLKEGKQSTVPDFFGFDKW